MDSVYAEQQFDIQLFTLENGKLEKLGLVFLKHIPRVGEHYFHFPTESVFTISYIIHDDLQSYLILQRDKQLDEFAKIAYQQQVDKTKAKEERQKASAEALKKIAGYFR